MYSGESDAERLVSLSLRHFSVRNAEIHFLEYVSEGERRIALS
jgi:hypothetical protein